MDRSLPRGRCPWRKHYELQVRRLNQKVNAEVGVSALNKGATFGTHMSRQVLPQAPSPTMTSLRRISAILIRNKSV